MLFPKHNVPGIHNSHTTLGGGRTSERGSFFMSGVLVCVTILSLVVLCALLSVAIVFPLWAFAMHLPRVYTIVCLIVFVAWGVIAIVRRCRRVHTIQGNGQIRKDEKVS